ncbi:MAG: hypothetical protein ABSG19_08290 [Candidatus Aminicenantales bacterium]
MKPFQFEKWYFDFTMPTGEVVFFFLARTRIFGRADFRLSLTGVSPRGAPIHRSLILQESAAERISSSAPPLLPVFGERPSPPESEVRIRTFGEDFSLDLVFLRHPEARPVANPMVISRGKRRILWEPVQGRSMVRGSVRIGGQIWSAEGCDGYIDRLVSDVFPLFTPVRTLYWGRLHHPAGSLVYAVIPRLRPWALLTWSSSRETLEFDTVDVSERGTRKSPILGLSYPPAYTLTARNRSANIRLDVENIASAVETGFIANEEIPGGIESRAINFLARNPRGIKFFSRGRVLVREKGQATEVEAAPFFSEIVSFS